MGRRKIIHIKPKQPSKDEQAKNLNKETPEKRLERVRMEGNIYRPRKEESAKSKKNKQEYERTLKEIRDAKRNRGRD